MSYTYGHEQAKKKPADLFQKLVSQGHSPGKARKLVQYGKKMSAKQLQCVRKQCVMCFMPKLNPALPKTGHVTKVITYLIYLQTNLVNTVSITNEIYCN